MRRLRLAMAQINPTVGALRKNADKILAYAGKAERAGCDLVVFPELALTGYPPEDLLMKPGFVEDNLRELKRITRKIRRITALVGFVDCQEAIYNAAAIIHGGPAGGRVAGIYRKVHLPNYGVFDEKRYFSPGEGPLNFTLSGVTIGIGICEDIWRPDGPARAEARAGAELIVNMNASPFHYGKAAEREEMLGERATENRVMVAYCNSVGGQDELVFDGGGLVIGTDGVVVERGASFTEELMVTELCFEGPKRVPASRGAARTGKKVDVRVIRLKASFDKRDGDKKNRDKKGGDKKGRPEAGSKSSAGATRPRLSHNEEVLRALLLGTRDYVKKNGFKRCVLALSGGIDSALVAAIAAEALGPEGLTCVFMPSVYSSPESAEDARRLAKNLGVEFMTIPIQPVFERYLKTLKRPFEKKQADLASGVTEENLQARTRGNLIMALSNKFGWLVLTTGNKSELSVGYATLYGDMAGGFSVIKDVPKTMVYELSHYINERAGSIVIPERTLTRAPSAELRPDQRDQDTLPPYEVLDPILKAYVEDDCSLEEIVALGFKKTLVKRVIEMVDRSEYKRRQGPPGVKITPRAFGKDRRMPITNSYKEHYPGR